jgi:hypothetical protein
VVIVQRGPVADPSCRHRRAVGAGSAYLFVQILSPVFTVPPGALTIPALQLGVLGVLLLGGIVLSALAGGTILRRLEPVELLREE